METIIGIITDKQHKSGNAKATGKPYEMWTFQVNGAKFSTFDADVGRLYAMGDNVEVTLEQDGKYKKLLNMKVSTSKPDSNMSNKPEFHLTEEAIRSNALTSAIAICKKEELLFDYVIRFEQYIREGIKDEAEEER